MGKCANRGWLWVCLIASVLSPLHAEGWRLASFSPEEEEPVVLEEEYALPPGTYVDLDAYLDGQPAVSALPMSPWSVQLLPDGFIYPNYLAGQKESRLSTVLADEQDTGLFWDTTLGGRAGLVRIGSSNPFLPQGIQLDVEGSAQVRLEPEENMDLRSADFRAGVPLTIGLGRRQFKFGYYHLSSHLGDEFLMRNPGFNRLNYVRDALILGHSVYHSERLRTYIEAAWAFNANIAEPWEFQVGVDYAPLLPTGFRGAPFFAINGHLREEVHYSGSVTAHAGWAWRSDSNGRLLRLGLLYFNGESSQYAFHDEHERLLGVGVWLD